MDAKEFKPLFKRIMRQLDERNTKVSNGQRKEDYYQNKRKEFIELIDKAIDSGWFIMPKKGTRIYNIYFDQFN